MAVDLFDLVESLKREVNPPGSDFYPNARDEDWLGHLSDAFWEIRLRGMLGGFVESDGSITPTTGADDLGRDLQQLIVLFAAYRVVLGAFQNARASFKAASGPVSYETAQAVTVLRDVLKAIQERLKESAAQVGQAGAVNTLVFDSVMQRTGSQALGETWWVR